MVVATEAATMVVLVVMMMEDVITQNSKIATAVEKEGMMSFCEKERKRVGLYFVCTKFIFMRMNMQRLRTYVIVMDEDCRG